MTDRLTPEQVQAIRARHDADEALGLNAYESLPIAQDRAALLADRDALKQEVERLRHIQEMAQYENRTIAKAEARLRELVEKLDALPRYHITADYINARLTTTKAVNGTAINAAQHESIIKEYRDE